MKCEKYFGQINSAATGNLSFFCINDDKIVHITKKMAGGNMHFIYKCDRCGVIFSQFEASLDLQKFGFDCLTVTQWKDIINFNEAQNTMYVTSLCDACATDYEISYSDDKVLLH